jgi:hypothetical protein
MVRAMVTDQKIGLGDRQIVIFLKKTSLLRLSYVKIEYIRYLCNNFLKLAGQTIAKRGSFSAMLHAYRGFKRCFKYICKIEAVKSQPKGNVGCKSL